MLLKTVINQNLTEQKWTFALNADIMHHLEKVFAAYERWTKNFFFCNIMHI